jgi:hypothetical protein
MSSENAAVKRPAAEEATLMDNGFASSRRQAHPSLIGVCGFFSAWLLVQPVHAVIISHADAVQIGRKIWQNECNGTVAGLTSWNEGENFASLGIGHFIWYPKGARGPFEESFPKLVEFVRQRGAPALPKVIRGSGDLVCPWNSRSEFMQAQHQPEMNELRDFLAATVDLQAEFLVARLQQSLQKMTDEAPASDRTNVQRQFDRVSSTGQGCYALVDYVNFKGEGVLHTERYAGQGWGLLQVLQEMRGTETGSSAVVEFAAATKTVLNRRVQNSPPERKEARWLPGWLNRVRTYAKS